VPIPRDLSNTAPSGRFKASSLSSSFEFGSVAVITTSFFTSANKFCFSPGGFVEIVRVNICGFKLIASSI
jgi:hypothetical protein